MEELTKEKYKEILLKIYDILVFNEIKDVRCLDSSLNLGAELEFRNDVVIKILKTFLKQNLNPPKIISNGDFKSLEKKILYSGNNNICSYVENLLAGNQKLNPSNAGYGVGYYFSDKKETALEFAQNKPENIVFAKLSPNAKVADCFNIEKKIKKFNYQLEIGNHFMNKKSDFLVNSKTDSEQDKLKVASLVAGNYYMNSVFASLEGYDVINVWRQREDYYVIINPSALIILNKFRKEQNRNYL